MSRCTVGAFVLCCVCLVFVLSSCNNSAPQHPPQNLEALEAFSIKIRKSEDSVRVSQNGDTATVEVRSPSGIGGATITPVGSRWPTKVSVHLHLTGLESFQAGTEAARIKTSISSGTLTQVQPMLVTIDDQQRRISEGSNPLWTPITIVGLPEGSEPRLPLKQGFFKVDLPSGLFVSTKTDLSIAWIDFYRR